MRRTHLTIAYSQLFQTYLLKMSESRLRCILHTDTSGELCNEPIQVFDRDKWRKVKDSAEKRMKRPQASSSKYWEACVNLQDDMTDTCGYHGSCYNRFNAVAKNDDPLDSNVNVLLRSQASIRPATTSGVLPKVCIFCHMTRKKKRGKELPLISCEYDSPELRVKEAAEVLLDKTMLTKIGSIDFHTKEVKYHNECKRDYLNKARAALNSEKKLPANTAHEKAFQDLCAYIQSSVIDNNRPEFLTSLHRHYCQYLDIRSVDTGVPVTYSVAKTVGDKIVKHFGDKVNLAMMCRKKGLVLFNQKLCKEEAFSMAVNCSSSEEVKVVDSARILRSAILSVVNESPPLPISLSLKDFKQGQSKPPDILVRFLEILFAGTEDNSSERVKRQVNSTAQDILFCTSNGKVQPAKHLCMGIGIKSLTGSRKIVDLLNRLGHSVSYHVAEGIETEIASSLTETERILPDMLLQQVGLCTGLAFDNYDELTETLSGRDTLHDTVGICFQNRPTEVTTEDTTMGSMSNAEEVHVPVRSLKRRRQYEPQDHTLLPYKKKPSLRKFKYKMYSIEDPPNLEIVIKKDQIWMLACYLFKDTPMWRGWNSLVCEDPLPLQAIGYMENIDLPPTRLDVVQETLRLSQKVAEECGEKYAIVHYDLGIAKPAFQIQAQESPKYDNVFICIGTFHLALAYFASLGYILDSSGGIEVLSNSEVLASGSVSGFLSGKHYNRCKRLHPLLATAVQILHFQRFTEEHGPVSDELRQLLIAFSKAPSQEALTCLLENEVCNSLLDMYTTYCEKTRKGDHGKTAKFWMMYVDLVHYFLLLDRACRTNDVDLYIFILGKICPIFFATHHPNYARYTTRYQLNMINMENTHEGIRANFEGGALSIRRTSKSFSRCAVDLTLEQTINKDAASRHTGITAFTQCVNARKRWTVTRSMRGAVVASLLDMAAITTKEDISQELKPYRIKRDNSDLEKLILYLEDTMNPFQVNLEDKLYCLSTGRSASSEVERDLTNLEEKGQLMYQTFIDECQQDPTRFERPIKKKKVKNFASDAVKTRVSAKDQSIKEIRCTRDLFGRLLYLGISENLDLKSILSHPLTPVPFSLCHITGAMNKTEKSALMRALEERVPTNNDVMDKNTYIIDTMFFLRTLPELPPTFGGIAKVVLQHACSFLQNVHIVSDTYRDGPSIKSFERNERGKDSMNTYQVTGPFQRRPSNFNAALSSNSFKSALLKFFKNEWRSDNYVTILEGHTVYFALEESCYLYTVKDGHVEQSELTDLQSFHEEADTRILFHAKYISQKSLNPVIVVRSCDTDVFILLLCHSIQLKAKLWMDTGLSSKNTRRNINITELGNLLTDEICSALPAFHAFTGSDYTAAFLRKGKTKPFKLMESSKAYTQAFSQLGSSKEVDQEVLSLLEEYVCSMYGVKKEKDVNAARTYLFKKLYCPGDLDKPLEKLKSADPSCLPPCKDVLLQKIKRTNYVAHLWKNAQYSNPVKFNFNGSGWRVDHNSMEFVWFEGEQSPCKIFVESGETRNALSDEGSFEENELQEYSLSSDEDGDL